MGIAVLPVDQSERAFKAPTWGYFPPVSFYIVAVAVSFCARNMPETPQSHYRVGSWTVTKLKDELRSRNLSPVGNKSELIERLERSHNTESVTPKRGRGRPAESKYQVRIGRSDELC